MLIKPSLVEIEEIREIFAEIDVATQALQQATGLTCRTNCGDCCRSPHVEATVTEMLPAAADLLARGKADVAYDTAVENSRCIFYQPNAQDPSLGRCQAYELRPSVCRLFGYAATRSKTGEPALATCKWQKLQQPEVVAMIEQRLQEHELPIAMFSDYASKLETVASSASLNQNYPINEALRQAIAWLAIRGQMNDEEERSQNTTMILFDNLPVATDHPPLAISLHLMELAPPK